MFTRVAPLPTDRTGSGESITSLDLRFRSRVVENWGPKLVGGVEGPLRPLTTRGLVFSVGGTEGGSSTESVDGVTVSTGPVWRGRGGSDVPFVIK